MRVKSPIAEIDFVIGELRRDGDTLVISGDPSSSIEAEVRMSPRDVGMLLRSVIFNPVAIFYFFSLPFLMLRKSPAGAVADTAREDPFGRLNKPW